MRMNRKEALKLAIKQTKKSLADFIYLIKPRMKASTQLTAVGIILCIFIVLGIPLIVWHIIPSVIVFVISLLISTPIGIIVGIIFIQAGEILARREDC